MDINYYSPKRKLDCTALYSLDGVLASDIFEIIIEAERLSAMAKLQEDMKFLSGLSAVLYTADPCGAKRVAFECAANLLDLKPIVVSAQGYKDCAELKRKIRAAKNPQLIAKFFDLPNLSEMLPIGSADEMTVNIGERGAVEAIACLYAVKKEFSRLKDLPVACIEDGDLSSATIAFSKAQTELTVFSKSEAALSDISDKLSQFTPVRTSSSVAAAVKNSEVIVFNSNDPEVFSSVMELKKENAKIIMSTDSPLFKNLEIAGQDKLSFNALEATADIISAILSLVVG